MGTVGDNFIGLMMYSTVEPHTFFLEHVYNQRSCNGNFVFSGNGSKFGLADKLRAKWAAEAEGPGRLSYYLILSTYILWNLISITSVTTRLLTRIPQ